ncbi:MAG: hypothetical protein IJS65_00665, partial [Clostridia bacterium]|nr:hypothetical protein [Clostridia bacterium]
DFNDFCERMSEHDLNRKALEGLICCGAFDSMGYTRAELLQVYDSILDGISMEKRTNVTGQLNLFDEGQAGGARVLIPDVPEFSKRQLLSMEKASTGLYLSGHPAETVRELSVRVGAVPIAEVLSANADDASGENPYPDGSYVTLAGVVSELKIKPTKQGKLIAYATLEDESAAVDLLVFDSALSNGGRSVTEDGFAVCYGRISLREDEPLKVICELFRELTEDESYAFPSARAQTEAGKNGNPRSRTFYIKLSSQSDARRDTALSIMRKYPGNSEICLFYADTRKTETPPFKARDCAEAFRELSGLFDETELIIKFKRARA